jgi:hypothetical protein
LVWNVEPAALMVPLAVLVLDEALLVAELLPVAVLPPAAEDEPDEEHAARDRVAATTTAPTAAACCLRPTCISSTPYSFYLFPRPREQPQRVSVQIVACQYSLPTPVKLAGKRIVDRQGPEG